MSDFFIYSHSLSKFSSKHLPQYRLNQRLPPPDSICNLPLDGSALANSASTRRAVILLDIPSKILERFSVGLRCIKDIGSKFLDLWIAFEFLISGEKTKKLFTKYDREKIRSSIDSADFNNDQKDAIKSKINMLNDSPLMAKFNHLIQKLGISFSEDELIILEKMREKRTNLIHGKWDISIDDYELNKMRTILEKIFIGQINFTKCQTENLKSG